MGMTTDSPNSCRSVRMDDSDGDVTGGEAERCD